jgi:hypothetical protein
MQRTTYAVRLCQFADLIFVVLFSVADPDPGSSDFLPPRSGMNFVRIPDPALFLVKFSYIIFRILIIGSL